MCVHRCVLEVVKDLKEGWKGWRDNARRKREGKKEGRRQEQTPRTGEGAYGKLLGKTEGGRASCRNQLVVQQSDEEGWTGRNRDSA